MERFPVENQAVSTSRTTREKEWHKGSTKNISKYCKGQMDMSIQSRGTAFPPALKQQGFLPFKCDFEVNDR
ncbi:hypothetical protein MSLAZ_2716 [Methanosarcina lacustris Z-7289]|uniref:Uncharacterized protein n=1 Tax=Methanosarcina lacustris Z-7289 TaxID=1434111 RepID=A0A0E3S8W7_9EURY|nr:hypothetical protein MSLAZ_2716 [Methanosarcina lacustris Z-7289]